MLRVEQGMSMGVKVKINPKSNPKSGDGRCQRLVGDGVGGSLSLGFLNWAKGLAIPWVGGFAVPAHLEAGRLRVLVGRQSSGLWASLGAYMVRTR